MMLNRLLLCVCAATLCYIAPSEGQDKSIKFRLELLTPGDCLQALTEDNWNVDGRATEMIEKFSAKQSLAGHMGEEITLEIVTVGELGFSRGATFARICKQASTRNFQLCNPVDAVELCRAYEIHTMSGQSLLVATEPTRCKDGKDYIFLVKSRSRTQRVIIGWLLDPDPNKNVFLHSAAFVFERKKH